MVPLLADQIWQGGTTYGSRGWSRGTSFCSPGPTAAATIGPPTPQTNQGQDQSMCPPSEGLTWGSPLGTIDYIEQFVSERESAWMEELDKLEEVAKVHGFTQSSMNKLAFLCRTTRNIDHLLLPLKEKIRLSFIPTLAGRAPPSNSIRDLLALPPRLGGIGIINPTQLSTTEYPASVAISAPLRDLTLLQFPEFPFSAQEVQILAKSDHPKIQTRFVAFWCRKRGPLAG